MYVNWKKSLLWALALTVVLSTTTVALAEKGGGKGKPGGGDPPSEPVLPPMRYEVQYFTVPTDIPRYVSVNALNNLGQAVGNFYPVVGESERHAYLYDPAGLFIPAKLYDPAVHANQAIDLHTIGAVGIPEYWHIASAVGMNNQGIIVGYLATEDTSFRRGYILDLTTTPPELEPIPDEVFGTWTYPRHINDNGDILGNYSGRNIVPPGMYVFNVHQYRLGLDWPTDLGFELQGNSAVLSNPAPGQPAQVACVLSSGVAMRYTLDGTDVTDGTPEEFPDLDISAVGDINEAGTFCGETYIPVNRKGTKVSRRPFRYNTALDTLSDDSDYFAVAINSDGDTVLACACPTGPLPAIHHDTWGLLYLDDLIADADAPFWVGGWRPGTLRLNDRDPVTDFGQIAGRTGTLDGAEIGFILTPVPAP